MPYISINTDVDIDLSDIDDDDVLLIVEEKLGYLKKRSDQKPYDEFLESLIDIVNDSKADSIVSREEDDYKLEVDNLHDSCKLKVCKELISKYSLEELETFLNK